jgi:metal-responsive CopG/Arc/MetJ family transcriptional regulator
MKNRARVTVTVDPKLLKAVDAFVDDCPGADRSKVFDEALRLWYKARMDEAMEWQYQEELDEEQRRERDDWRAIQRAAAIRLFSRDDEE